MIDNEPLSPEQAAVYCAVHGYELWQDKEDNELPWVVIMRDDWHRRSWSPFLTKLILRQAIAAADQDFEELAPDFSKMYIDSGRIVRIELPPTPMGD